MRDLTNASIPQYGLNANSRPKRRSQHDRKRIKPLDAINRALNIGHAPSHAAPGAAFVLAANLGIVAPWEASNYQARLHPTKGWRFGAAA